MDLLYFVCAVNDAKRERCRKEYSSKLPTHCSRILYCGFHNRCVMPSLEVSRNVVEDLWSLRKGKGIPPIPCRVIHVHKALGNTTTQSTNIYKELRHNKSLLQCNRIQIKIYSPEHQFYGGCLIIV